MGTFAVSATRPPDKSRLRASSPRRASRGSLERFHIGWKQKHFCPVAFSGGNPIPPPIKPSMLFLKMLYGSVNISNRSVSPPPPGKVEPPTKYRFGPITPAPKPWLPNGIGASDIQVPVLRS
jgi:hypothetical protein